MTDTNYLYEYFLANSQQEDPSISADSDKDEDEQ